jgi:hypothetical protein
MQHLSERLRSNKTEFSKFLATDQYHDHVKHSLLALRLTFEWLIYIEETFSGYWDTPLNNIGIEQTK